MTFDCEYCPAVFRTPEELVAHFDAAHKDEERLEHVKCEYLTDGREHGR